MREMDVNLGVIRFQPKGDLRSHPFVHPFFRSLPTHKLLGFKRRHLELLTECPEPELKGFSDLRCAAGIGGPPFGEPIRVRQRLVDRVWGRFDSDPVPNLLRAHLRDLLIYCFWRSVLNHVTGKLLSGLPPILLGCPAPVAIRLRKLSLIKNPQAFEQRSKHSYSGTSPR